MSLSRRHVAVLMGGWSLEREVSLVSGNACAEALINLGYRVTKVDVDRNIASVLTELRPDIAFNALHGRWGEDGCIQGILEIMGIPYTHSGVMASALAMNKEEAKKIFATCSLPCAKSRVVNRVQLDSQNDVETPFVIKPVNQGSSVGVHIIRYSENRTLNALISDETLGEEVMVEEYIPGRELTCAVLGNLPLDVIEIHSYHDFYDYDAKYELGKSRHTIPAEIDAEIYEQVRQITLTAHQALGCRSVSRADLRYDDTCGEPGRLILLEVNTQPGMTPTSLVPELAENADYSFEDLVRFLVEDASCNR